MGGGIHFFSGGDSPDATADQIKQMQNNFAPPPTASDPALDDAANQKKKAQGAASTIFAGRQRAGMSGGMSSGSSSGRMLLGS